ncbi:ImmA/IrrE family metallo-endopeptidase [uncultured Clostridium sp.]|uniref:ImmA/IrrE family metallo-endopeptidase n=1 Tax=uncultured Clostridium sp. TaxID=59620 RepID=UPI0025CD093D|nr:ImmA/IrrE family metallo-endopeptidase [uncultured Clostridium sp.]
MGKVIYLDRLRGWKVDMDEKVKNLLKEYNLYSVPVDPIELARYLDVDVYWSDFKDRNLSGVISKDNEKVVILISDSEPYNRTRFTVAHELGHLELHMNSNKVFEEYHRGDVSGNAEERKVEIEANSFAASLLMPTEFVRREFKKLSGSNYSNEEKTSILADIFKVSESAMMFRLMNLGLISCS